MGGAFAGHVKGELAVHAEEKSKDEAIDGADLAGAIWSTYCQFDLRHKHQQFIDGCDLLRQLHQRR